MCYSCTAATSTSAAVHLGGLSSPPLPAQPIEKIDTANNKQTSNFFIESSLKNKYSQNNRAHNAVIILMLLAQYVNTKVARSGQMWSCHETKKLRHCGLDPQSRINPMGNTPPLDLFWIAAQGQSKKFAYHEVISQN
jgi:hypothetical protein